MGLLLPALEALHDIAFAPRFRPQRLQSERKAVLNEMLQVNTLEYRIETWSLSGLHWENRLGRRFPIGLEEQIRRWSLEDCKKFHKQWYQPENATLYLVGDIPSDQMLRGVESIFMNIPMRDPRGTWSMSAAWGPEATDPASLFRRRLPLRQPHLHAFGVPQIGTAAKFTAAALSAADRRRDDGRSRIMLVHNELLSSVQVFLYAKSPVRPLHTLEDLRYAALLRLLLSVLRVRLQVLLRCSSHGAVVELDHSDSMREGCAVTSLSITANPTDWHSVLCKVVQEVRAIVDYGITEDEVCKFRVAVGKEADKECAEGGLPSDHLVKRIMSSSAFGHVVMHPQDSREALEKIVQSLSLREANAAAHWMLGFLAHYGSNSVPLPAAVVVCAPKQTNSGDSGQPLTAEALHQLLCNVPDKHPDDVLSSVDIPEALCTEDMLQTLLGSNYMDAMCVDLVTSRQHDPITGVTQLRLPNGARVNYVHTKNASQGSMRLLFPGGRAAEEVDEVGAAALGVWTLEESGAVADFSSRQVELFAVTTGLFVEIVCDREATRVDALFPVSDQDGLGACLQLLHMLLREPCWELASFERALQACKAKGREVRGSLERATEEALLSAMYPEDHWLLEPSTDALANLSLSKVQSCIQRQLFDAVGHMEVNIVQDFDMLGRALTSQPRSKVLRLTNEEGEAKTAEELAAEASRIREQATRELEESLWRFLGSVEPKANGAAAVLRCLEIADWAELAAPQRRRRVHLLDPEERAVAVVGGGAPNRWGVGDERHSRCMVGKRFCWGRVSPKLAKHPLYASTCLLLLKTVLNARLNSTVRGVMGLAYSVSFEVSLFDVLKGGWFQATVSAHPSQIEEALAAVKSVIKQVRQRPISPLELAAARQHLQRSHQNDAHSNAYWITLLSHLQTELARKDISCVRDVVQMLQSVGPLDVHNGFEALLTDEEQLFVAVGTQGPVPPQKPC